MRLAFIGDVHGNERYIRSLKGYLETNEVDRVIQVGDMGILWRHSDPDECPVTQAVESLGVEWWFIDGNHDNHVNLRNRDPQITDNIRYIPRGTVEEIDGVRFGFLGGAYSIDKDYRSEGLNWWPEETPTREEAEPLMGEDLDILVTHDIPDTFKPARYMNVGAEHEAASKPTRELIQEVVNATNPAHVFSGHWHQHNVQMVGTTKMTILDMENMPGNVLVYDTKDFHEPS